MSSLMVLQHAFKNAPEKRDGSRRRPAGVHVGAGGVDVDPDQGLVYPPIHAAGVAKVTGAPSELDKKGDPREQETK